MVRMMHRHGSNKAFLAMQAALLLVCAVFGVLILQHQALFVLGIGMVLVVLGWLLLRPELATLAAMFALYANLPVIATRFYGIPPLAASAVVLLLAVPMAAYVIAGQEKLRVDQPLVLMLAFLVVLCASSLCARDTSIAAQWIGNFVQEGLVLYFLIINAIRRLVTLQRVIWVLLLAGSLLGALSLYQELTQSYDNQYGGLAQSQPAPAGTAVGQHELQAAGAHEMHRARGPIGEKNRYAQMMLVLLPLALFRYWGERARSLRLCAATATVLILGGVLLSYSRGAFAMLLLLLLLLLGLRYIRPVQMLLTLGGLLLMMALAAPGSFARMYTIRGVEGLVSDDSTVQPDGATRGRATEMFAALLVFRDHPILGVGPGQYEPFYSKQYQLNPDIAFRHLPRPRRAHSLYFEIAAESGALRAGNLPGHCAVYTDTALESAAPSGLRPPGSSPSRHGAVAQYCCLPGHCQLFTPVVSALLLDIVGAGRRRTPDFPHGHRADTGATAHPGGAPCSAVCGSAPCDMLTRNLFPPSQEGARTGGGGRSPGRQGTRVGHPAPQHGAGGDGPQRTWCGRRRSVRCGPRLSLSVRHQSPKTGDRYGNFCI